MSSYKKGDKFVVTIGEAIESEKGTLYRSSDFSTLVFDDYGLDNLPQLVDGVNEACYNKGLADAWEAARKINCYVGSGGISTDDIVEIFGRISLSDIMKNHTPQEAIAKIKEWENSKEIRRGDEVTPLHGANIKYGKNGIVFKESCVSVRVVWEDKDTTKLDKALLTKTGRNFADKLDALLGEIGGDTNG